MFLDDVTVSRRHAEFRPRDGQWEVVDVGSLNGSYVNRRRIDSAVLAGGDEVQLGKYRFAFLEGVIERLADPRFHRGLAIHGHRVSKIELKKAQVIEPENVVRVLVGVEHGVDQADLFA